MRKPFEKDWPLTQTFGNKLIINGIDIYAQFGLKGHNGLDYGLPTSTKVLAPHNGKVIESTLDSKGYGLYVKIENSMEGSVLAHNKELRVGVGDIVEEGQLVALSNNSGNSTGPHLHWGYYRFPRDRNNGYNGFIDQTSYLNPPCPKDILDRANAFVAVAERLNKPVDKDTVLADIEMLLKQEQIIVDKDRTIQTRETELEKIKKDAKTMSDKVETLSKENERLSTSLQGLTEDAKEQSDEIKELQRRLEEVKNYHLIETATVADLINEIVKRLFKRR